MGYRMQSIFEKNLAAWEKCYPETKEFVIKKYNELKSNDTQTVVAEQDYSGETILAVNKDEKKIYLAGKRNYQKAVEKWGENYKIAQPAAFIFLVGIGNPSFAKQLDKVMTKEARILIYEPSMEIFFKVMECIDISNFLDSGRSVVFLVDGINDEMIDRSIESIINVNMLPYFDIYVCPNYNTLFLEKTSKFVKSVSRLCENARIGLNTNIRYLPVRSENVFHNIIHVNMGYDTKQFTEFIPRDIPTFIVGAGPSLDKNIDELKRAKGKGFIIACDTAVKPLLVHGIVPDLYVLVDGLKPVHLIKAEGTETIPLLTSVTATYGFLDQNKAIKIFYNENELLVNKLFYQNGKSLATMPCGGSVATSAFAFAYLIGMKNIVLVGQDLALTGDYVHAKGTFDKTDDKADGHDTFLVDGNYDEKVSTRGDFYSYLKWFEYYIEGCQEYEPQLRVINATEGGAKIKYTEIKTLQETIDELCVKEIDIQKEMGKIAPSFNECQRENNVKFIKGLPDEFRTIAKGADELKKSYKKLEKLAQSRNMDTKAYLKLLKKIEKQTKSIEKHPECMSNISETLKIADFIINSESGMAYGSINEEGKNISKQGIMYCDLLKECAELFADLTNEIYGEIDFSEIKVK